jgi:adenylate cyclase
LQDQVASSVVGAIEPKLRSAEIERAIRKPTESLDAYDLYLRALAQLRKNTEEGTREASVLAKRALEIDPSYLPAASLVAHCRSNQWLRGWGPISDADVAEALYLAKHTIESGSDDPDALSYAGWAVAVLAGEGALGSRAIDRAITLNPNSALALGYKGMVEGYSNHPAAAIEAARRAVRLSPLDAWHAFEATLALAYLISARYEEAIEAADKALTRNPRAVHVLGGKATACISLGRVQEAGECIKRFCELRPGSTIANIGETMRTAFSPEVLAIHLEGLRKAGLPEE